jgi:hypothetical protein
VSKGFAGFGFGMLTPGVGESMPPNVAFGGSGHRFREPALPIRRRRRWHRCHPHIFVVILFALSQRIY